MGVDKIGPYRIEGKVGSGGMGAVYKAWDERLERWVAIKTVLPSKELSAERRERFKREARSAARLNHPAIAQVHDILTEGGRDHIVMELVAGKNLADVLLDGPMNLELAVSLARQIAEGLGAAHNHDVIHRDLKAENIMVCDGARAKILDFGLAKNIEPDSDEVSLTEEGIVLGTCRAMSPEQAEGQPVDCRSDLFSLGSLLYRMVTGRHPFATHSPMATMRRVVFDQPPPANTINIEVPEQLAELIDRLLSKDPAKRPASAHEVAQSLAEVATVWAAPTTQQSAMLRASSGHHPAARTRLPWMISGAAVLVAMVSVVLWQGWLRGPQPTIVVAVLEPDLGEIADAEGADRARDAVRMALLNGVASLKGLAALDSKEVDAIDGTPAEVASAVAADQLVLSEIEGCDPLCRVQLRRLDANGRVLPGGVKTFEVVADELYLLANAATANLRAIYPDHRPRAGSAISDASAEDFEAFLEVRRQLVDPPPGTTREMLLEDLVTIRYGSPSFLEAHLLEADVCRYLFQVYSDRKFLERARNAVERAHELSPTDPRPRLTSIDIALAAGDYSDARALVSNLEQSDPGNPNVSARKGQLEFRLGNPEGARALLQRAVASRPSWKNFHRLADAELHCGNFQEATAHLRTALKMVPGETSLKSKLAEVELLHGDIHKAEEIYSELSREHESPVYLSNLGLARMLNGQFTRAVQAYDRSNSLSPNEPVTMLNLADSYLLSGQRAEAQEWYTKALSSAELGANQSSSDVLSVRAQCLAHLGRGTEAVSAVRDLLRLSPLDPEAHFVASLVNLVLGQEASAISNAEKSLELGMSPRWFNLSWFQKLKPKIPALAGSRERKSDSKFK